MFHNWHYAHIDCVTIKFYKSLYTTCNSKQRWVEMYQPGTYFISGTEEYHVSLNVTSLKYQVECVSRRFRQLGPRTFLQFPCRWFILGLQIIKKQVLMKYFSYFFSFLRIMLFFQIINWCSSWAIVKFTIKCYCYITPIIILPTLKLSRA